MPNRLNVAKIMCIVSTLFRLQPHDYNKNVKKKNITDLKNVDDDTIDEWTIILYNKFIINPQRVPL